MRRPIAVIRTEGGFTLIEIIVTIVIISVLSVILAQIMVNQTSRSFRPVETVSGELALRAVMADIAADWELIARTDPLDPLGNLQDRIQAGNYWDETKSFSGHPTFSIRRNHCIQLGIDGTEQGSASEDCSQSDTILKVSISVSGTGQHLTTLFVR